MLRASDAEEDGKIKILQTMAMPSAIAQGRTNGLAIFPLKLGKSGACVRNTALTMQPIICVSLSFGAATRRRA